MDRTTEEQRDKRQYSEMRGRREGKGLRGKRRGGERRTYVKEMTCDFPRRELELFRLIVVVIRKGERTNDSDWEAEDRALRER